MDHRKIEQRAQTSGGTVPIWNLTMIQIEPHMGTAAAYSQLLAMAKGNDFARTHLKVTPAAARVWNGFNALQSFIVITCHNNDPMDTEKTAPAIVVDPSI